MKNILPIIGAIALGSASCEKASDSVRHTTRQSTEAIMENDYQPSEAATQQKSFVEWAKLEPMDTFIKNNPGKSFEFYYAQAEKIDNDPTASIDDGGEQTQKERILQNIQHDIQAGKYTLQDISMTSSSSNTQKKAAKSKIDGDDGYDENNLPAYIQAIDNGLEPVEITKRPSTPTGLRVKKAEAPQAPSAPTGLRIEQSKKTEAPAKISKTPRAPTGLTVQ